MDTESTEREPNAADRRREAACESPGTSGRELTELVSPISPETFLEEYWQRKPLYVKGTPEKFRSLFDRDRFYEAISNASELADPQGFRIAVVLKRSESSLSFSEEIAPNQVDGWLAQGTTICVNDIGAGDDRLTYYATAVREQMSYAGPVRFNCYVSPDGSGADSHFDARVSTTLQIEGKKRWRFSARPSMDWPPSNAQLRRDGSPYWMLAGPSNEQWAQLEPVDESSFTEVVLEPGDLLCLPAGTWHNAKAIGFSLSLNLTFSPLNFFTFLARILEPVFLSHAQWRGSPPPVCAENTRLEKLPPEVEHYVGERLSELRAFLETLETKGAHVNEVWRELVKYQLY
jgi:50S ribosomal protein L16 3-hydroxylase